MHIIHTIPDQPSGNGKTAWGFNGNMERPTFTPSLLVRFTEALTDDEIERLHAGEKITPVDVVCHSFITDGMIQFLGDCTHSKAGQTVPLGDL